MENDLTSQGDKDEQDCLNDILSKSQEFIEPEVQKRQKLDDEKQGNNIKFEF